MTDSTLHKVAETQTLDTAVVLTTAGVFRPSGTTATSALSPLTPVAGVSLLLRKVLTLQRAGITHLVVLTGDDGQSLKQSLQRDPRVRLTIRWRPVREFPVEDPRTWEALSTDIGSACLVVGAHAVFSRGLVERLRREVQDGKSVLVVSHTADPRNQMDSLNPLLQVREDRLVGLVDRAADPAGSGAHAGEVAGDLVVLSGAQLRACSSNAPYTASPLLAMLQRAAIEGQARAVRSSPETGLWYHGARNAAELQQVERTLFRSLGGEIEGFVDTYVNRKVSHVFTRLFLRLGLSPNSITVLSMVIGLLGASVMALGTYMAGVIGALLFQLSVIVDCCDGEVARLTFRESRFGRQLDLAADNVVHVAIFAAIAWGVFVQQGGWTSGSSMPWLPLALGGAAVFGNILSFVLMQRAEALYEKRSWIDPIQAGRVEFIMKKMASRDFSVVVLLFALLGLLSWFLWFVAIGANVFWVMVAWVTRPSPVARA